MSLKGFWRNVATVLSFTAMEKAIPLAVLPVLTRIVVPEQLGHYFLWFGAANILIVLSTARLDMAIFSAESKQEVEGLLRTIMITATGVAVTSVVILRVVLPVLEVSIGTAAVNEFGTALALFSLSVAVNQSAWAVLVYRAEFIRLGWSKVMVAASVAMAQLAVALAGLDAAGLIYAQVGMTAMSLMITLSWIGVRPLRLLFSSSVTPIRRVLKENYRYPLFSMPADFTNNLAAQLPLFIIDARFGAEKVAFFALTLRSLGTPISLLANSLIPVFREKAGRDFREKGNCREIYHHALKSLALLAIVPFAIVGVFGQKLFLFVFGLEWGEPGLYAQILAPMYYLKFLASPLSFTFYLAQWQVYDLVWQITLLIMTWSVFSYTGNTVTAVTAYSVGYGLLYIVYLFMSHAAAGGIRE